MVSGPLDEDLAKFIQKSCTMQIEFVKKELREQYTRPYNCGYAVVLRVNPKVWMNAEKSKRNSDNALQDNQSSPLCLKYNKLV